MKMSDVWGWDAIPQNYGHYTKEQIAKYPDGDYYGFLFITEEAANGVAYAVRNHDALTERVKELEDKISSIQDLVCSYKDNADLTVDFGDGEEQTCLTFGDMESLEMDIAELLEKNNGN